ncbi:HD family phosphohydrolase [Thermosulfidibacter takaii]|uniref:HD family phosphohydrolase n=1 Tax=Thermosulfidibacter takaii TaxID=412593 RepID=UPI00130D99B9|nr:HDIG domain-containing metalloprotein [Thermosulfidibacter takaii]
MLRILIFSLLLTIALIPYRTYILSRVTVGKPSPITVVSPVDLEVVDEEATETLRKEVEEHSPKVYRLDSSWTKDAYEKLSRLFFILRGLMAKGDLTSDRLKTILESDLGVRLTDEKLSKLMESKFSFDVETAISEGLKKIASYYIVDTPVSGNFVIYDPLLKRYIYPKKDVSIFELKDVEALVKKVLTEVFPLDKEGYVPAYAVLLTAVVKPTLYYDDVLTQKYKEERLASIAPVKVVIKKGEVIVTEGQKVTKEAYKKLKILSEFLSVKPLYKVFLGILLFALFATFIFSFLWKRIYNYGRIEFEAAHRLFLFLVLESVFLMRLFIWLFNRVFSPYAGVGKIFLGISSPVFLVGLLSAFIFGFPLALVPIIFAAILTGFLPSAFEYLPFVVVISSICAGAGIRIGRGANAFLKGIIWGVFSLFVVVLAAFFYEAENSWILFFAPFLAGVSVFFSSFTSLPLFERFFGVVTDLTLLELANLDHPLLRALLEKAPGTYNHSMYVGILAESAANAVGANPILAKVGGYFHDIGKLKNPKYFVENTMGLSMHTKLSPNMSRLIIISHVKDGVELGLKYKLPKCVIDIIEQHHGTSLISYFYHKAKKMGEDVDESLYRYPGPKPRSKEAAIVMLADCVEAAVRSLDEPTPSKIKNLVSSIINNIFMDGQLDECDLTFKDVRAIQEVFVKMLISLYHKRVKYPDQEKEENGHNGTKSNGSKTEKK